MTDIEKIKLDFDEFSRREEETKLFWYDEEENINEKFEKLGKIPENML